MKVLKVNKTLALLLAVLLILPSFTLSAIALTSNDIPQFVEGDIIYQPTLTGEGNGVPDGWLAVPEKQVPWYNDAGSNGWINPDSGNSSKNKEINPEVFTFTDDGLKVSIGSGDFSVVFPALVDADNKPVVDYVYTIELSGVAATGSDGSIGPITHAAGGEDYKGGAYLMAYMNPSTNSYRRYTFENRSRLNDYIIKKNTSEAITYRNDKTLTITVYHCNNANYYYLNGVYKFSQIAKDCYDGSPLNGIGMNFCGTQGVTIKSITVKSVIVKGVTDSIRPIDTSIRYCDTYGNTEGEKSQGLRFTATVDKGSSLYKALIPNGTYSPSNDSVKFGMLIMPTDLISEGESLTVDTPTVVDTVIKKIDFQDDDTLQFTVTLLNIPEEHQARLFTARVYVKEKVDGVWEYTYSMKTLSRSFCGVANIFYEETERTYVQERLTDIFEGCPLYEGPNAKRITFSLLADFHYKAGMYKSSIADMQTILDRAHQSDADFIIHAGDFCNDYAGSPELMRAYLENNYNIPAFGVYGNHELETKGNSMGVVTPRLNSEEVVWGTADGKIGDGSIGYYYYDLNGFRIIGLDTNYYYDTADLTWKHNLPASSGPPKGTSSHSSLGPTQLEWLKGILLDAADNDIPCIVVMHYGASGVWSSNPDAAKIRQLYKEANEKQPGTVLMSINGHLHTNRLAVVENVLYMDMNTTLNGAWRSTKEEHYTTEAFKYVTYDNEGNVWSTTVKPLNELSMGKQTWFFADPLSAIVSVSSSGRIVVEGAESHWISGLTPSGGLGAAEEPRVSSGTFNLTEY